jgi:replication factor C large subunit
MDSFWKCDKSPGEIMLWLIETIPKEYEKPDEIAEAFDNISRADIFNGRIPHSQAWSLMSYSAELTALGTAMAKQEKYKKFTKYMPPTYLMRMGRTRMSRAMRKKVAGSIGEKLHCSRKVVGEHYGYYRMMAKKYNKAVGSGQEVVGNNWLGLEEDELVFLKK